MANYYHELVNTYITHVKTIQYIKKAPMSHYTLKRLIIQNFNKCILTVCSYL